MKKQFIDEYIKKNLYINIFVNKLEDYTGRYIINISFVIYNGPTFY